MDMLAYDDLNDILRICVTCGGKKTFIIILNKHQAFLELHKTAS